jgi:hypothetical protein
MFTDASNILPTAMGRGTVGSRFKNNFHTIDAKENVSAQCLQHNTMKTSHYGSIPSIPDAYLLLQSNTSQNVSNITNCLSTDCFKFGKNSPACGSAMIRLSQIPTLLKSKIPHRSTTLTSQLPTESGGQCKTLAVSSSEEGTEINCMHEALNCSKSKRTGNYRNDYRKSEFCEKSASDLATGSLDGSKCLISQKLKNRVYHKISEESSKMTSPEGISEMLSNKISTFAYEDMLAVSTAKQTDLIIKNDKASQTDRVICAESCIEKLVALPERLLKHWEQLDAVCKKQESEMCALKNQTNVIYNEVVNILRVFSHTDEVTINSDIMFEERNNHPCDEQSGYKCSRKDSEECSRTPLRRSARIAARTPVALAAGNKLLPSTPECDGVAHYPSVKSIETRSTVKMNKPESVYKELCTSFHFLKTPQSSRRPVAKTPKATSNQLLKQRLKDQILSLYE